MGRELYFQYTAKTAEGKTVRGTACAQDRSALSRLLHDRGLYLVRAKERAGKGGTLKSALLAEFCRQLSGLVASGVGLVRGLEIVSQEEGLDETFRNLCGVLLSKVRSGLPLSQAMEDQMVFPPLMLGMIRAGEETGTLGPNLERLHIHYEKQHEMEQEVRSAMSYPLLLCILALGAVVSIFAFILPSFSELFLGMEDLPLLTKILMAASDYLVECWYIPPICLLGAIVMVRLLLAVPEVRLHLDAWKLRLPILGGLYRSLYTARFARSLASLYGCGLPILRGLEIARDTIGNAYLQMQFGRVLTMVGSGAALSQALGTVDGFRAKLVSAIQAGEQSGQVDTMLGGIAAAMEFDARQTAKRMLGILEPVLVLVMAVLVGVIVVGVMVPLTDSYGAIQQSAVL